MYLHLMNPLCSSIMKKGSEKKPAASAVGWFGYRGSCFLTALLLLLLMLGGCGKNSGKATDAQPENAPQKTGSMELFYADQFSVDYYSEGYTHIHVEDGTDYVLIPEGKPEQNLGYPEAILVHAPCKSIYLASSASIDLFRALDSLTSVSACSVRAEDYDNEEIKNKIKTGAITYIGKYSNPDYESLLSMDCDLVIENTMIYHNPKVREQLIQMGFPVLVERSSYESHPLGRLEWIRLYGLLLGKQEAADAFFAEKTGQVEALTAALDKKNNDKAVPKVAFFYVSANGYVNVRKPGDYLCKMMEMAGGRYALGGLKLDEENALSTVNVNWEDFYLYAVNADILIYNSNIDGGVKNLEELFSKNELFRDFKAVKEGRVWCTNLNMYQEGSRTAEIIEDFYRVIQNEDTEQLMFMYRVE